MLKARTDKPRIWGYARVSKGKDNRVVRDAAQVTDDASDEPSNERQAAGITKKTHEIAVELDCLPAAIYTDSASGVDVGFDERSGFKKLMRAVQSGDHVVVWQLSRIDRNPFRLYRACEFLFRRGVHIHSYGDTAGEIDLSTAMGRAHLAIFGIVNDLFIDNLRKSTKEALQWRKERGLAYCGTPPLGKRREYTLNGKPVAKAPRGTKQQYVRLDVWDEYECRLIREIKHRHDRGESFDSIGRDFGVRDEKTATGKPWVYYYKKKRGANGQRRIDSRRVRRCCMDYEKLLEEGGDLEL